MLFRSGGGGNYGLKVDKQTVYSEANGGGNYSLMTIKIKYLLPAHEQYRSSNSITYDYPTFSDSSKNMTLTSTGNTGFVKNAGHDTKEQWKTVSIRVSTRLVGVASVDRGGWKTYDWCSINFNLEHPAGILTFNGNKGQLRQSTTAAWSNTVSKKLNDRDKYGGLPEASRQGYTFTGFYTTSSGTGGSSVDKNTQFCRSCTVYAQWKANQYKIHYNSNGGSGTMNDSTVTYDGSFTLPKNTFTNNGYQFLGWSKTKDGDVAAYEDQEAIKYQTASDLTLYAIWGNGQYKISFMPNGAQADAKIIPVKTGESYTIPSGLFTRKGYTFVGWAKTPDAVRADYTNGTAVSDLTDAGKTIKLYAIWKKNDGSINKTNIIHDEGMFTGDIEIEGQNGTGYSHAHTDSEYANIDKTDAPGYFTDRY